MQPWGNDHGFLGYGLTRGSALPQGSGLSLDPPRGTGTEAPASLATSSYAPRFAQGASVVARVLFMVETRQATALGTGAGRKAVRSQRSPTEKCPWKDMPDLTGVVETAFIRPIYLGDNVLPDRLLQATPRSDPVGRQEVAGRQ